MNDVSEAKMFYPHLFEKFKAAGFSDEQAAPAVTIATTTYPLCWEGEKSECQCWNDD